MDTVENVMKHPSSQHATRVRNVLGPALLACAMAGTAAADIDSQRIDDRAALPAAGRCGGGSFSGMTSGWRSLGGSFSMNGKVYWRGIYSFTSFTRGIVRARSATYAGAADGCPGLASKSSVKFSFRVFSSDETVDFAWRLPDQSEPTSGTGWTLTRADDPAMPETVVSSLDVPASPQAPRAGGELPPPAGLIGRMRLVLGPGYYRFETASHAGNAPVTTDTLISFDSNLDGLPDLGEACPGDLDGNGVTDLGDLATMLLDMGGSDPLLDLDGNGTVDIGDAAIMMLDFGPCPDAFN